MEGILIGALLAVLAYLATQSHRLFVGEERTFTERLRTKSGGSIAATIVVALLYWALHDTGLRTDQSFVFAFIVWGTFSTLGAITNELSVSRPGLFVVPLGTSAIVGALLLVTMNVGVGIGLLRAHPLLLRFLQLSTLISGMAFLGVCVRHWRIRRGSSTLPATDAWKRYGPSIVGMTLVMMFLGALVVITDGPRRSAVIPEPQIETTLVRVHYLSLEARDGVAILRFTTDHRRGEPFYVVRYADPLAELVELGALLQVQYKDRHQRDREVVDIKVLPRPQTP